MSVFPLQSLRKRSGRSGEDDNTLSIPTHIPQIPIENFTPTSDKSISKGQILITTTDAVQSPVGKVAKYIISLWSTHVSFKVSYNENTNHLANESTFLSWLQLSIGMSMTGLVVAQVSRFQRAVRPGDHESLRFNVLGKPQASVCQIFAAIIILVGAFRFFTQQAALIRGNTRIRGYEFFMVIGLVMLLLLTFLFFILIVDVANLAH